MAEEEKDELKKLLIEQEELEQKKAIIERKIEEEKVRQERRIKQREKEIEEEEKLFDIELKNVFYLIIKTLGLIDKKIMNHSQRVAYLFYKILQYSGEYDMRMLAKYAVVGLFHDIGEFKIQNDKNIQEEDRNNAWAHSIFSYLYTKNFSPLGEMSSVILYHHFSEKKFGMIQIDDKFAAAALLIADRLERYLNDYESQELNLKKLFAGMNEPGVSEVVRKASLVALYAIKQYDLSKKLMDNSYIIELEQVANEVIISEEEKWKYLEMLMYAFDFQTDEAFIDSLRTNCISRQIGEVMLVSLSERKALQYGTLLYDIGKFAIPLDILRKPGRLTRAEMDIVRAHVSYTEYLLAGFVDEEVINIAGRHHERLDGSGYPQGLTGDDLTLGERILAVADVVSALSADRSYRKALDKSKILQILRDEVKNKKLCPFVVDALVKKYDNIMVSANTMIQKQSIEFIRETDVAYKKLYSRFKDF